MKLLPLAAEPFTPPTDRDMLPTERRDFVLTHRTCVFRYARQKDGPAMSIVYYIPIDSGELLAATMREPLLRLAQRICPTRISKRQGLIAEA